MYIFIVEIEKKVKILSSDKCKECFQPEFDAYLEEYAIVYKRSALLYSITQWICWKEKNSIYWYDQCYDFECKVAFQLIG